MTARPHPQAAAVLESAAASPRPNAHLLPVEEARANFEADFAEGGRDEVAEVADIGIGVDGGEIPARVYRPAGGALPVVVYLHGGGWVLGSIDSHDALCRALAIASGCAVVSVGYRLGPEVHHPTAAEDAYAAACWAAAGDEALGLRAGPVAVAGDSAGGNLATAVALLARERGKPEIVLQALVYPVTTTDLDIGFDVTYEGWMLYRDEMRWHQDLYVPDRGDRRSSLISPLDAADLCGLPPAVVVSAACDPLHAQAERYAAALQAAGVGVELLAYAGQIHGFVQMPDTMDDARHAIARIGGAIATALRR